MVVIAAEELAKIDSAAGVTNGVIGPKGTV